MAAVVAAAGVVGAGLVEVQAGMQLILGHIGLDARGRGGLVGRVRRGNLVLAAVLAAGAGVLGAVVPVGNAGGRDGHVVAVGVPIGLQRVVAHAHRLHVGPGRNKGARLGVSGQGDAPAAVGLKLQIVARQRHRAGGVVGIQHRHVDLLQVANGQQLLGEVERLALEAAHQGAAVVEVVEVLRGRGGSRRRHLLAHRVERDGQGGGIGTVAQRVHVGVRDDGALGVVVRTRRVARGVAIGEGIAGVVHLVAHLDHRGQRAVGRGGGQGGMARMLQAEGAARRGRAVLADPVLVVLHAQNLVVERRAREDLLGGLDAVGVGVGSGGGAMGLHLAEQAGTQGLAVGDRGGSVHNGHIEAHRGHVIPRRQRAELDSALGLKCGNASLGQIDHERAVGRRAVIRRARRHHMVIQERVRQCNGRPRRSGGNTRDRRGGGGTGVLEQHEVRNGARAMDPGAVVLLREAVQLEGVGVEAAGTTVRRPLLVHTVQGEIEVGLLGRSGGGVLEDVGVPGALGGYRHAGGGAGELLIGHLRLAPAVGNGRGVRRLVQVGKRRPRDAVSVGPGPVQVGGQTRQRGLGVHERAVAVARPAILSRACGGIVVHRVPRLGEVVGGEQARERHVEPLQVVARVVLARAGGSAEELHEGLGGSRCRRVGRQAHVRIEALEVEGGGDEVVVVAVPCRRRNGDGARGVVVELYGHRIRGLIVDAEQIDGALLDDVAAREVRGDVGGLDDDLVVARRLRGRAVALQQLNLNVGALEHEARVLIGHRHPITLIVLVIVMGGNGLHQRRVQVQRVGVEAAPLVLHTDGLHGFHPQAGVFHLEGGRVGKREAVAGVLVAEHRDGLVGQRHGGIARGGGFHEGLGGDARLHRMHAGVQVGPIEAGRQVEPARQPHVGIVGTEGGAQADALGHDVGIAQHVHRGLGVPAHVGVEVLHVDAHVGQVARLPQRPRQHEVARGVLEQGHRCVAVAHDGEQLLGVVGEHRAPVGGHRGRQQCASGLSLGEERRVVGGIGVGDLVHHALGRIVRHHRRGNAARRRHVGVDDDGVDGVARRSIGFGAVLVPARGFHQPRRQRHVLGIVGAVGVGVVGHLGRRHILLRERAHVDIGVEQLVGAVVHVGVHVQARMSVHRFRLLVGEVEAIAGAVVAIVGVGRVVVLGHRLGIGHVHGSLEVGAARHLGVARRHLSEQHAVVGGLVHLTEAVDAVVRPAVGGVVGLIAVVLPLLIGGIPGTRAGMTRQVVPVLDGIGGVEGGRQVHLGVVAIPGGLGVRTTIIIEAMGSVAVAHGLRIALGRGVRGIVGVAKEVHIGAGARGQILLEVAVVGHHAHQVAAEPQGIGEHHIAGSVLLGHRRQHHRTARRERLSGAAGLEEVGHLLGGESYRVHGRTVQRALTVVVQRESQRGGALGVLRRLVEGLGNGELGGMETHLADEVGVGRIASAVVVGARRQRAQGDAGAVGHGVGRVVGDAGAITHGLALVVGAGLGALVVLQGRRMGAVGHGHL